MLHRRNLLRNSPLRVHSLVRDDVRRSPVRSLCCAFVLRLFQSLTLLFAQSNYTKWIPQLFLMSRTANNHKRCSETMFNYLSVGLASNKTFHFVVSFFLLFFLQLVLNLLFTYISLIIFVTKVTKSQERLFSTLGKGSQKFIHSMPAFSASIWVRCNLMLSVFKLIIYLSFSPDYSRSPTVYNTFHF